MGDDPSPRALLAGLAERGVIPGLAGVEIERLPGGVSADVFMVGFGTQRLVVKRAVPRLRVAQEWLSSPARVLREAEAMVFARSIRPDNVPEILDVDDERLVIVMRAASPGMRNWKVALLDGRVDPTDGHALAGALADWHSASGADPAVRARFSDRTHFEDLRISPFFLRVAEVHPDLESTILRVVAKMTARAACLVHGDFSPKNVLIERRSFWVLDWETAHSGDPTFDVAFLVSHLVCKAIHRRVDVHRFGALAETFISAYLDRSTLTIDAQDLLAQIGCLVLARVDGKSPVDYLSPAQQETARRLGRRVLLGELADRGALWSSVDDAARP